ncbi:hypothetical protein AQUSIP_23110 [Aquicella siphonis]|uniref:Uncharacterized protein n=1 Tax=Aquicella siphonis TaxID=254247 RepID=A0A5E4PJ47_9COXI|nr:hypothetical protein [Aquicella siphonis]VVC76984.1 hypothetical protein AQUSIP_23110 [Aquicella siphonis]
MKPRQGEKNNDSKGIPDKIEKEMAEETKRNILSDPLSNQSGVHQFFYRNVPPFSTMQRRVDEADCAKSFLAATLFNKSLRDKPIDGVDPINITPESFSSCMRLNNK